MAWFRTGGGPQPSGTINTTPKVIAQTINVTDYEYNNVGSIYEEVPTSAAMDAINIDANIGKMYKYTGTTDTKYTNGRLYIVIDETTIPLTFTANTAGSTISMSVTGTPTLSQNFAYSTDNSTWNTFTPGTTTITLTNAGDKVYFKGNNPNGVNESTSIRYTFTMTGSVAASGNIMSLIDNGACTTTTIPCADCFYKLFNECDALITPPALPATTLANECYGAMFGNCTALTAAPVLPATIMSERCYLSMFRGCASLAVPPALPATTLAANCYYNMFAGCETLETAPALPALTLSANCYGYMFNGCAALIVPPSLPATTLANGCYTFMFFGCIGLTHVPVLLATTLKNNCYSAMFHSCMSLHVSDAAVSGTAENIWRIPSSGVFTNTEDYEQDFMFTGCSGTRSSDDMTGEAGMSYTYYTQNTPV